VYIVISKFWGAVEELLENIPEDGNTVIIRTNKKKIRPLVIVKATEGIG
jgi:hypothetical protein